MASGQYPPPIPPRPLPPPVPSRRPVPTPPAIQNDPEVIALCPGNQPLYATAYWYSLPSIPTYEVCSHCFASHIRSTPWAAQFQKHLRSPDPSRRCRFDTPRMLQLWSHLAQNHDWPAVTAYMAHRASIPNCTGKTPVAAEAGIKWYSPRGNELHNFGVCAACYEDLLLATPFAAHFGLNPQKQPPGELWNCKMPLFVHRAIETPGKYATWAALAADIGRYMQIPPCDGPTGIAAGKRGWYRPRRAIEGLVVCDSCYWEYLASSLMEREWEAMPVGFQHQWTTWACDMSLLPMKVAYLKALMEKDYGIWWNAARAIMASPPCPSASGGVYPGTWYKLPRAEVYVCAQCFAGIIFPFRFGNHFVQAYAHNGPRTCIFNAATPRREQFLNRFDESISLRDFSKFENYVVRLSPLPLCSTSTMVHNRRWYGTNDFLACESCWEEFVKDTSLASQLSLKGVVVPAACCDMYSARMRRLWMTACSKNNLAEFTAFAKHRSAVYAQTVPRMQEILAMAKMRMEQKQTLMMSSIMLQGASNVVGASQSADFSHTLYGNAALGYHATPAGAQGAAQFDQALGINPVQGGEMMQVAQLEAMWKQVE
ncbi:uncharacterized protein ACLA_097130 [Aspergillus clavatus NRRL 1]|uniref:Integral membrane protein n=1 Tax=Aspergillus clavatus (strain ATCC 1007 / CBS 513.65 / DSM 816 / NCTC 3887 / NRRL 1 / QM 1276 / 107) TaxID=344612 RepID=A1CMJ0_ASPCL|nr:uncharacterized protein ACLA_097130 [Aspergillus clavatus NRRL 1]EAW08777.1 conserved hypothetical protein [Aspergillus clavatus NRRL 1]